MRIPERRLRLLLAAALVVGAGVLCLVRVGGYDSPCPAFGPAIPFHVLTQLHGQPCDRVGETTRGAVFGLVILAAFVGVPRGRRPRAERTLAVGLAIGIAVTAFRWYGAEKGYSGEWAAAQDIATGATLLIAAALATYVVARK